MTPHYFHPVPGSARLRTATRGANEALERVEGLVPGALERHLVDGEPLGRAVVRDRFVPVLRAVFDELAPLQTPIEQLLYLHLYRHSYGEDRNHCRLARRELGQRTGLSPRRFNCALAGLVRKGHVRLVQRDRRGTLYRVLLPGEILNGRVGSEVLLGTLRAPPAEGTPTGTEPGTVEQQGGRKRTSRGRRARGQPQAAAEGGRARRADRANRHHKTIAINPAPTAAPAPSPRSSSSGVSAGQVVEAVLARFAPRKRRQAAQDVLQDVLELLEEGITAQQLIAQAARFTPGRTAPEFARAVRSSTEA